MAALGLAIMIVAGAVTVDVVLENTRNTDASVVGQTISNVDLGGFFTAGVLVGVFGMIGLMLLLGGLRRANRLRLERKELARSYEGTAAQADTLQEERDRLAAELEQERSARARAEQAVAAPAERSAHPGRDGTTRQVAEPATTGTGGSAATERSTEQVGEPATDRGRAGSGVPGSGVPGSGVPGSGVPVYPADSAAPPAGSAGTATRERSSKPTLRERLLGR
jgi:hypothetical protein